MYLKRCRFGYFYDEENRTIYEHRGNILEMNGREKYLLTTIYYRYTVIIHRRKAYSSGIWMRRRRMRGWDCATCCEGYLQGFLFMN